MRYEVHSASYRLGQNQPVKWVAMMERQSCKGKDVFQFDRKELDSVLLLLFRQNEEQRAAQ